MTLFPSADAFLELLRIDQDDLLANRAGRLGQRQARALRRAVALTTAAPFVLGGLLIAGGFVSRSNGGQVVVPWLLGGLLLAAGVAIAAGTRRRSAVPVRCVTGTLEIVLVTVGRASELRVLVDGGAYPVPVRLRPRLRAWRDAVIPGHRYHVYVHGPLGTVVGIEPA